MTFHTLSDGFFTSPFVSMHHVELYYMRITQLKKYFEVNVQPHRLIVTVFHKIDESADDIRELVGDEYSVERMGRNIVVRIKE